MANRRVANLKVPVNVSLGLNSLQTIEKFIESGKFNSRSEVLQRALDQFTGEKMHPEIAVAKYCEYTGIAVIDGYIVYPDGGDMKPEIAELHKKSIDFVLKII